MDKDIKRRALLFGRKVASDERVAAATEYGMIAGLVAVANIGGATQIGFTFSERMRCTMRAVDGKMSCQ